MTLLTPQSAMRGGASSVVEGAPTRRSLRDATSPARDGQDPVLGSAPGGGGPAGRGPGGGSGQGGPGGGRPGGGENGGAAPVRKRRDLRVPILLQLAAMVGIGALLYPAAADWFATLHHDSEISGYVEQVAALPGAEREAALEVARAYNAHMPQGILRDPYTTAAADPSLSPDAAYQAYQRVLRVSDNGVIGQLAYPRLGIGLPIYHGTAEEVIAKGIGHLYGSSLPVGGPSTHSVLTAHSGLINASLFTALPDARVGDTFQVTVLGETRHYRVESIQTVLPDETEKLRIVDGEDRVTLITCTPIGINSHRLMVHGVRIPGPEVATGPTAIAGDGRTAGFPWWALAFAGGSAIVAYLLFAPPRKKRASRGASPVASLAAEKHRVPESVEGASRADRASSGGDEFVRGTASTGSVPGNREGEGNA